MGNFFIPSRDGHMAPVAYTCTHAGSEQGKISYIKRGNIHVQYES